MRTDTEKSAEFTAHLADTAIDHCPENRHLSGQAPPRPEHKPPHAAPRYEEARRAQLRAVGASFLRLRPWIVCPGMLVLLVMLALSPGVPRAQLTALCVGFSVISSAFIYEARRARRAEIGERWLFGSLLLTVLGITAACVITGGLRSPLLPIYFAPVVVTFAAFGRRLQSWVSLGLVLVALTTIGVVALPWPLLPNPQAQVMLWVSATMSLLLLYAGVTGLSDAFDRVGQTLDSTRDALFEAATERLKTLEVVGAKVAHEVRNPLASVKGLVQLLRKSAAQDPIRQHKRWDVLEDEIERIERILSDYLSFSRPFEELRLESIDLAPFVDDIAALVRPRAQRAGIGLGVEVSEVTLRADPVKLRSGLLNLLSNALEATPSGGFVTVRAAASADDEVVIEVTDTGRGMDPSALSRLGQPFYTTRHEGAGLGVVLARSVAEQHGGSLRFESIAGVGTTATLRVARDLARPIQP